MKAKLIIEDKEIEVEISEEEYKKLHPSETGYERVSKSGDYFHESGKGDVESEIEDYYDVDNEYYESANYYSDKTVAENNARADKLMRQLRRFSVEHRENKIDWYDIKNHKYYINYDFEDNKISIGDKSFLRYFGAIYFDSRKTVQTAINKFHDELIWYFTEYKDSL